MKTINITNSELNKLKTLGNGSEAKIYLDKNNIIKVYQNPQEYDINKIKYFCDAQKYIERTKFPHGAVFIDGIFSGCIQEYFNGYKEFDTLNNNISMEQVIFYLKLFLQNLEELLQNKIYPIDLYYGNVLYSLDKQNIQIIDLDGKGSIIKKEHNRKLLQESLFLCLSTILETIFNKDIEQMWYLNYKSLLARYPFKNEYIDIMMNEKISLDFLYEFLEYIKKDEKLIFKDCKKLTLETSF